MRIDLTYAEAEWAASVGVRRNLASKFAGRQPSYGIDPKFIWNSHIEGAAGELAVAKGLNVPWLAGVDTFQGADLGQNWQVRSSRNPIADLRIHDRDNPDHWYILVVGELPQFRIVGYILGHEAKRVAWFGTRNKRPPAYWVSQRFLTPIHDKSTIEVARR